MTVLEITLMLSILLCGLTAGFVFAFASVVMPGIAKMTDGEFIRAFQVIDGVIQAGQPVFGVVWLGSAVSVVVSAVMGATLLDGVERIVLIAAALSYLLGVQLPTFAINVPLNNKLRAIDVGSLDAQALDEARSNFESRWNRWNTFRTVMASLVVVALTAILARI